MGFVNHFILIYGCLCSDYAVQWLTRGADAAIRTAGHRLASTALHVRLRASVVPRASTAVATACTERLSWASWLNRRLNLNFGGLNCSNRWVDGWAGRSTQRRHVTDHKA